MGLLSAIGTPTIAPQFSRVFFGSESIGIFVSVDFATFFRVRVFRNDRFPSGLQIVLVQLPDVITLLGHGDNDTAVLESLPTPA